MGKENNKNRGWLLRIVAQVPELEAILMADHPLSKKRRRIRKFLSDILIATFDDDPKIPPMEWVLTRDAVRVFRNIMASRSERNAGFSLLKYINDLLHKKDLNGIPKPEPGFYAEIDHLIRGVVGITGVYNEKQPTFSKHEGRKAARYRSADLSRMARKTDHYINRYTSGLDQDAIRRRNKNKTRILKYFGATDLDWEKWKWHTKNIIKDADTLAGLVNLNDDEYKAVKLANKNKVPFGITPYYLSLIDYQTNTRRSAALRAQVIPTLKSVELLVANKQCGECSMDFMLERDTSPIEGITRRYPKIVIIKPIMTCPQICSYCQRNWQIEDVYSSTALMANQRLDNAIKWIKDTPEIREILVTGGDPLLLSDKILENLLYKLSKIKHITRIRIGSRMLVTLPQRVTEALAEIISRFHVPGKREVVVVSHFEHAYEITPQAMEAVQKIRRQGIAVYNQLVYTFYNSRKFEAAALRDKLRLIGVTPYYTFNTKGKEETDNFRVPIPRLLQEQKEEARLFPGTVRTDEIVFNVPRLGKNYLRATQHHDVISILPDGRRVYEFHPWEEKLSLVDTYMYTDVSVYDYLKRLKDSGEKISDYRTIWYYY
ncbi:MAG: KamA family radical SAM protein [Desulfobacterales bacterium]|nr:KamA family radical SAM protein [Desulfobacterales bacterium]